MTSGESRWPSDKFLEAFEFAAELAEKEEAYRKEVSEILLRFLEVKDSMEELLSEQQGQQQYADGPAAALFRRVELLNRQMELALKRSEVTAIDCVGQEADPELHCVVEVVEGSEANSNLIVKERVRGYRYRDSLLRRPSVVVAKARDDEHSK